MKLEDVRAIAKSYGVAVGKLPFAIAHGKQ